MSLEEPEEEKKEFLTFSLNLNDQIIEVEYNLNIFRNSDDRCDYCNVLANHPTKKAIDLHRYKYDSFKIILDYLISGNMPCLSKMTDLEALNELAEFMSIDDKFKKYINFDTDKRFIDDLSDQDGIIIKDELELRELLFNNEETDFRHLDSNYELEKLAKDMKLEKSTIQEKIKLEEKKLEEMKLLNRKSEEIQLQEMKVERLKSDILGVYESISKKYSFKNIVNYRGYKCIPAYGRLDSAEIIRNFNLGVYDGKLIDRLLNENNSPTDLLFHTILQKLEYKNYVAAGGFVYKNFSFTIQNISNDIDIFLITKNEAEAIESIRNIFAILSGINIPDVIANKPVLISYNGNVINLYKEIRYNAGQFRGSVDYGVNVQIILRLYNSIAQVISGFDIDACCVAYDGKKFYGMPRFIRAINYGYNIADPERQSSTYAQRLFKYAERGFNIAMPGLITDGIRCNFLNKYTEYGGLAKIITYYYAKKGRIENFKTAAQSDYDFFPFVPNVEGIYKIIRNTAKKDYFNKNIKPYLNGNEENDKIFYNHYYHVSGTIFRYENYNFEDSNYIQDPSIIPHDKYSSQVFKYIQDNNVKVPIKFGYDLDYILDSKLSEPAEINIMVKSSLPDKIIFKTKNSSTQMTNSFSPTNERWYDDLYLT